MAIQYYTQERLAIRQMAPGPERRARLIAFLTLPDLNEQGLPVNKRHQASTDKDDDIQKLLKKGLIERKRVGRSISRQTYLVLTTTGWDYARQRGLVAAAVPTPSTDAEPGR